MTNSFQVIRFDCERKIVFGAMAVCRWSEAGREGNHGGVTGSGPEADSLMICAA